MEKEDLNILRLMREIDRDGNSSQRELSRRLNISLGLVNTFLKRLVKKGYFKVKTMPRNRVKYFLTPSGLARKSRLTLEFLQYSLHFYDDIKGLILNIYNTMERKNVRRVLFFGAGEVAELAYLYLQQTTIHLSGIIDDQRKGEIFFRYEIGGSEKLLDLSWDMILITSLENKEEKVEELIKQGISREKVVTI
jgi:DNA-binding MarR family transcriptional regulator